MQIPTYFPHVDGLRALAVLAVMIYHLNPTVLPGGFVGVDIFFVISGYVVTASLAGHREGRLGSFLARFYARRLARLVPALILVLVATTFFYVLFVPRAWFNRAAETVGQAGFWGLSNIVLDQETVNYFEPRAELNPFTHTWSLGVEEQFYLVAPILLFTVLSSRREIGNRSVGYLAIGFFAIASFVACYFFGVTRGARFVFYHIFFRFWELAAGVILHLSTRRLDESSRWLNRTARHPSAVGLILALAALLVPQPQFFPWIRSTVAVVAAVLLIGLPLRVGSDPIRTVLGHRLATWIGLRSYSLYLWHWPIYVLARWTVGLTMVPFGIMAVVLTFAAAEASYRYVELPVRRARQLRARRPALAIGAFVLSLVAGWLAAQTLLERQSVIGLGKPTRQAGDWYEDRGLLRSELAASRQCEPLRRSEHFAAGRGDLVEFVPERCSKRAAATLFVIGDSHAFAYLPMFEHISAQQSRIVKVLQAPGCGYLTLTAPLDARRDSNCWATAGAALDTVLAQSRTGDIVFLPSLRVPRFISLGGHRRVKSATSDLSAADVYDWSAEEIAMTKYALEDAPRWYRPLVWAGLRVVFEAPKPVFRAHPFYCVDWFNAHNPDCSDGLVEPRKTQEIYRAPVLSVMEAITTANPEITIWDPLPILCDKNVCPALLNGRPLFFDADHISPFGNLLLTESFAQTILRLEARHAQLSSWPSDRGH